MNKNGCLIIILILLLITSCSGLKSSSYGLENKGYIKIIGSKADYSSYSDFYMVIDDNTKVQVSVSKDIKKRPEGKIYKITPGEHVIMIYEDDKLILKKRVFISSQQINKVYLP
jgi:hypothetical protein